MACSQLQWLQQVTVGLSDIYLKLVSPLSTSPLPMIGIHLVRKTQFSSNCNLSSTLNQCQLVTVILIVLQVL